MSSDEDTLPGGDEATAAEYVLRLLPEEEERLFERRMREDTDLAQDVEAWEVYFSTLAEDVPAEVPPPGVWSRIESRLFKPPQRSLRRRLLPYVGGALAAALIAWVVVENGLLDPAPAELVAQLSPTEGALTLEARFQRETGVLRVDRLDGEAPEGRVLELWLIADAGSAPRSLGLLDSTDGTVLSLPTEIAQALPGATLAVSDEPPGGSPTGAPTGTVRAAGQLPSA